jgi:trimeric autotransporter adhesin
MPIRKFVLLASACLLFQPAAMPQTAATAASAATAVPALVPYSGVALVGGNKNFSLGQGETSVTFLIFKDETGGEPLWAETQSVSIDAEGHYKVQLGASNLNGLPSDLFSTGEARWLEVQVAGQQPQSRVLLASVPYAMKAADASTLGGLPASAFALAGTRTSSGVASAAAAGVTSTAVSNVTTTGGTSGYVPVFNGAATVVDSPVFVNGANVGIGTVTPSAMLDVSAAALFENGFTAAGTSTFKGAVFLPNTGTATATKAYNSEYIKLQTSAYNSATASVVNPRFQLQAEAKANDTATPTATLNLISSIGASTPAETGFYFNANGTMNFAPGQTFPGTGITGSVNATSYDLGGAMFATGSTANQAVYLGFAGNSTSSAPATTAIGYGALVALTTGGGNTATGDGALHDDTTGANNTANGAGALFMNTTGSSNSAIGVDTLLFNTTGSNNTAVGAAALNVETTGSANTAVGGEALLATTTGFDNTGVGWGALMAQTTAAGNTAVGWEALPADTTGFDNTAVGSAALFTETTAAGNTAVGNSALQYSTTGGNNSSLGASAGVPSTGGALTNTTTLGAFSIVNQNNSVILGNTSATSPGAFYVNVGVGTATPRSILDLVISAPSALGPTLTLTNSGGGASAATGIDFNTYEPSTTGTYNPAARIAALNDGTADDIAFYANKPGGANKGLQATMTVFANGNVNVIGTLSASAKNFQIDHPLDPTNKYLVHASVESSEMMNIYSGNVTTDELGLATVTLPGWFEAENTDFRYQLTVIGQFAQAIIKDKIADGQFRIMTNASHVEVSWQITAVRQDAYAKSHPLVVEQEKPAGERGFTYETRPIRNEQPASAVDKHFPVPASPTVNLDLPRPSVSAIKPIVQVKRP